MPLRCKGIALPPAFELLVNCLSLLLLLLLFLLLLLLLFSPFLSQTPVTIEDPLVLPLLQLQCSTFLLTF